MTMGPFQTSRIHFRSVQETCADSSAAAMGYIRHAPERCVWGSDWPHPDATSGRVPMPDDVVLINLLAVWAPDEKLRHRILVENPETFYGFDPAKRPKAI